MPETIEEFVERLQSEGVEAGRQAAERIQTEAEQRASHILQQAEAEAARIRQQAEEDAAVFRRRVEGDMKLAVRDALLTLRETMSRMLERVLEFKAEEALLDSGFLRELIQEVLRQYASADRKGQGEIRVNLTEDMEHQLTHWAVHALREELEGGDLRVELHGTLKKAGFEYRVTDGTVELTAESVVELLSSLLRTELRRILSEVDADADRGNESAAAGLGSMDR